MTKTTFFTRHVVPVLLASIPCTPASGVVNDTDQDGVVDSADNCIEGMNADQRDSNGDGIGNVCDGDFDASCAVNFEDLGLMEASFFQSVDPDTDMNGDGQTNFTDLGSLKRAFFLPPGPSGLVNACDVGFVTYWEDTQPIFYEKCDPCHTDLGHGHHNIGTTYNDAFHPALNADCAGLNVGQCTIVRIRSGDMPEGSGCTGDQELVQAWIGGGLPE